MIRLARLTLVCSILAVTGPHALASQQDDLDRVRKRLAALQQEVEKTTESRSEAADALRDSERAISNSHRSLAQLTQQQHLAGQQLGLLQQQSRQIERDMLAQQAQLNQLLYQQYLGGKQEYLKLLLNSHDPNQIARDLKYYDYIARYRSTWLRTLRSNLQRMNAVASEARKKSNEIGALQAEQQHRQQELEREKHTHQQVLQKIALQLRLQRREMGRLQKDESRLAQLVEKLSQVFPQGGQGLAARPFAQLKGKLHLPVKGLVTNHFGTPRPDSNIMWKGLFIKAAANQQVKAIAGGRVVFADWLRGFGNLLIIDHGQGYMSLYGNNETLYKQVGDDLNAGEVIAAVGNSGGNEDSGLYFELRFEGWPLDPGKWMRLR